MDSRHSQDKLLTALTVQTSAVSLRWQSPRRGSADYDPRGKGFPDHRLYRSSDRGRREKGHYRLEDL